MYCTPFIAGKPIEVPDSELIDVINPADQSPVSKLFMGREEHMKKAIDAADAARISWGKTSPSERELILIRAADLIVSEQKEIIDLLIDEAGSTFGKAHFEIAYTSDMLRAVAGEARRIQGHVIQSDVPGMMSLAIRKPLGVVVGISPFNFPLILSTKKIAFALAAGNTFVLKPSEETSLICLKIAQIFEKAGLPPGVLNVVPGDGPSMGRAIFTDPRVKMVSFTGSTTVGRMVATECAKNGKKFVLEMGGKNPLIILKDADLDYAVDTACFGMFIHQGQICMAGSRVIVEAPIYDQFVERFAAKVSKLQVGNPRDPHTVIGPLIRASQCQLIDSKVKAAVAKGARLVTGGTYKGNFYQPTVLADVTQSMGVFHDELFGPVVVVVKAENPDQALALANNNTYGLSSAVLTNDMQLAMRFAQDLESGMVHLNGPTVHDDPMAPFGGVKDSGSGREGGHWSIDELTEVKWITIQQGRRQYPF